MRLPVRPLSALLAWAALSQAGVYAETGRDAWLRYGALPPAAQARDTADLPASLTVFESLPSVLRARDENRPRTPRHARQGDPRRQRRPRGRGASSSERWPRSAARRQSWRLRGTRAGRFRIEPLRVDVRSIS